eukprot:12081962-Alexandrium_andersonii.AAC.1
MTWRGSSWAHLLLSPLRIEQVESVLGSPEGYTSGAPAGERTPQHARRGLGSRCGARVAGAAREGQALGQSPRLPHP